MPSRGLDGRGMVTGAEEHRTWGCAFAVWRQVYNSLVTVTCAPMLYSILAGYCGISVYMLANFIDCLGLHCPMSFLLTHHQ